MKAQNAISQYLKNTGTPLTHLARKAGLNHSVLSRILSGNTTHLTVANAEKIAAATGHMLTVYEILGLEPVYVVKEVLVQADTSDPTHARYIEVAPASKDCITHTPSFGTTVGSTSLSRIPNTAQSSCLSRVFDFWVRVFGKSHSRTKLTEKRQKKIQTALKDFTIDQLIDSIQGHANDPWRQADPIRHELATLLRPANIERGLNAKNRFAPTIFEDTEDEEFWESRIQAEHETDQLH